MKTIIIALVMCFSNLAQAQDERAEVNKFVYGKPGTVVDLLKMGYEPHAWKLLQLSPSGSGMYVHSQQLQRPFTVAIRQNKNLVNLRPGMSVAATVKTACLKYVGPNSYKNLQGFSRQLRVYEVTTECK